MNAILASHAIPMDCLRADDFAGFITGRRCALLDLIEKAMGKQILNNQEQ